MPWEERNGRRYYYRKVRRGGRVFSVYVGGGIAGAVSAERDAEEKRQRESSRAELRRELARQDRLDALIDKSWLAAEAAARSVLEGAGYHQHKRQWRLKRNAAV